MTNQVARRFPAILIGGPPRAGKSVLSYSLTEALRQAGVEHYLLRAAPDGEGDWFQKAEPNIAQVHRRKGRYDEVWVTHMRDDLTFRHLPFLVDVGGRPSDEDTMIFDQCTHAILLITDVESEDDWRRLMETHHLPIIAILTSKLEGESILEEERPILRGTITNLRRHQQAAGPVFEILLARVKALFNYTYEELFAIHQPQAPTDLVVDLFRLHKRLKPDQVDYDWFPQDLPDVLDFLPPDEPLALYGRGPAWLYAAVAGYIHPHSFYHFDARRGWVEPIKLLSNESTTLPLKIMTKTSPDSLHLQLDLTIKYLTYQPELKIPLPPVPIEQGIILDGQLPIWLYTGLAVYYRNAPWVAIYYPGHNHAIVISVSDSAEYRVGQSLKI